MEYEVTDLLEAYEEYKKADEAYNNDLNPEYGVGTWDARDSKRDDLNDAFKKAIQAALSV